LHVTIKRRMERTQRMRSPALTTVLWLTAAAALPAAAAGKYPPLTDYMMAKDAEVALAQTAAPASITAHASVKVLTASGYETARAGDNGFVCVVLRGWAAPTYTPVQFRDLVYDATVRAPICFDAAAARIVLP